MLIATLVPVSVLFDLGLHMTKGLSDNSLMLSTQLSVYSSMPHLLLLFKDILHAHGLIITADRDQFGLDTAFAMTRISTI